MALFLSRTNTSPYEEYSSGGAGSDPIGKSVELDGSGTPATVETDPKQAFLVATDMFYDNIEVSVLNNPTGVTWEVSATEGGTYGATINPADMDATTEDQVTPVWLQAEVVNDGSVTTDTYTQTDVRLQANEHATAP